jgi:hypothetical protein
MAIVEALWDTFGYLCGLAIVLTFVVPPVGLFLLAFAFVFVFPVLFVVALFVWPISAIIRLATAR